MTCALRLAAAAIAVLTGLPAHASDGDRALSVFAGFASYRIAAESDDEEDVQPVGAALGVDYERGISDALSWRLSGGGGLYYADGLAYSGHATLGLTYLFDVLKYVPYANVGLGGIVTAGAGRDVAAAPLVELGLGLDILRSRELSYGFQIRFESLLQSTLFFTAGARITWRWGFF